MWNITNHIIFIFGFLTGTIISIFLQHRKQSEISEEFYSNHENYFKTPYTKSHLSFDLLRYGNRSYITESEFLFANIQILCLVLVSKEKNFQAIKNTWGKGCNAIESLYINKSRTIFPSKSNSESNSWIHFCEKVKMTPVHYNWLLIVHDDTFVMMENLRYYLLNRDHSKNFYLGHSVKFWNTYYNLGKAGYVISKGVITKMKSTACDNSISYRNKEDYLLGSFLKQLNISVTDTKDDFGFSLFHPYNLNRLLFPVDSHKFQSVYESKCCSRYTVTFNAMEGDKMYTYYYMLYTLQLFYDGHLGNRQPIRPQDESVWREFLKKQNLPENITNEEYFNVWNNLIDSPDDFGRNMRREDYTDSS